jgi:hypothetical protein
LELGGGVVRGCRGGRSGGEKTCERVNERRKKWQHVRLRWASQSSRLSGEPLALWRQRRLQVVLNRSGEEIRVHRIRHR